MDSHDINRSETVVKAVQQYFCYIFLSLWKKIGSKNCSLAVYQILRLFVNILSPDDKYSLKYSIRVFNATNSNAIISKSKNTFWLFFWIS